MLVLLGRAAGDLLAAQRDLSRGAHLLPSSAMLSPALLTSPARYVSVQARVRGAAADFESARVRLRFWRPALRHLRWLPGVGPQLAAAPLAADASWYAARSVDRILAGLSPIMSNVRRRHRGRSLLPQLVVTLLGSNAAVQGALSDTERANRAAHALPAHTGNQALDRGTGELRRHLPTLLTLERWLLAAPDLLGGRRTSRALVLLQDPRELRATGGFIGALALVTTHRGVVHETFSSSALPHEVLGVTPPAPEEVYTPETDWLLRDSNWSPDFLRSARLAAWFYRRDTGQSVDTVAAVQDSSIGPLLEATGPVALPAYGVTVTPANAFALTNRYVNGAYHGPLTAAPSDTVRKQFMGDVITAILRRLAVLPASRLPLLVHALTGMIARRDLMLYDDRPPVEAAIRASGASGAFRAPPGDFLAIVDDNRSYAKLNPYVQERADDRVRVHPDLSMDVTLRIHYHLSPSPADLEGAGPYFGFLGNKHAYQDFIRVYVPDGARVTAANGMTLWKPRGAYGMVQIAGRMLLAAGQSRMVTIHYQLPANLLGVTGFHRYRLTLRHQPGSDLAVAVNVAGTDGVHVHLAAKFVLRHDVRLAAAIHGARSPRLVRMPYPVWSDPYLPSLSTANSAR